MVTSNKPCVALWLSLKIHGAAPELGVKSCSRFGGCCEEQLQSIPSVAPSAELQECRDLELSSKTFPCFQLEQPSLKLHC